MKSLVKLKAVVLAALCFLAIQSCGSTRNDQGVSFTAFGWFQIEEDDDGRLTLNEDVRVSGTALVRTTGQSFPVGLGLMNNMTGQAIRQERVYWDFYIEGAALQPPSTTMVLSGYLAPGPSADPADEEAEAGTGSSLPPGLNTGENMVFWILNPISFATAEWLQTHRASLPDAPFMMTATARASGVTTAGKRVDSNSLDLAVQVLDFPLGFPPLGDNEDEDE